jgi:GAF domain-containing protein
MFNPDMPHFVAIIGINEESIRLLSRFLDISEITIVKILNPYFESISDLSHLPQLDIIIDTTGEVNIQQDLRRLRLSNVEIMSGLSARILLEAIPDGNNENVRRVLKDVGEIHAAVRLAKNKNEILSLVLNVAIRAIGADSGSIMLTDPLRERLSIVIAHGLDESVRSAPSQVLGEGVSGTVGKNQVPVLLQGTIDPEEFSTQVKRDEIVSSICSPMMYGDDLIGVLNVNSRRLERMFSEKDLVYISRIAAYAADIIRTSKEYEDGSRASLTLSIIGAARDIITKKFRFDERVHLLVMKIANSFDRGTCNYYIYNDETNSFFANASSSFSSDLERGKNHKLSEFFAKQILHSHAQVTHRVLDKESNQYKWYIAEPIKIQDNLEGVLFLHFYSEREEIDEERAIISNIAGMISDEMKRNRDIQAARLSALKYSAISECTFDLVNTKSLSEFIRQVLSNANLILEADTGVFRLYDKSSDSLERYDHVSFRHDLNMEQLDALDSALANDAVSSGKAIYMPRLNDSPYEIYNRQFISSLSIAFKYRGKLMGTLTIYDKRLHGQNDYRGFTEYDRDVFVNFSRQITKVLNRFLHDDAFFSHSKPKVSSLQPVQPTHPEKSEEHPS